MQYCNEFSYFIKLTPKPIFHILKKTTHIEGEESAHGAASIKDPLRAEYGSALSSDVGLLWVQTPRR
jgi:hypothetical protein